MPSGAVGPEVVVSPPTTAVNDDATGNTQSKSSKRLPESFLAMTCVILATDLGGTLRVVVLAAGDGLAARPFDLAAALLSSSLLSLDSDDEPLSLDKSSVPSEEASARAGCGKITVDVPLPESEPLSLDELPVLVPLSDSE